MNEKVLLNAIKVNSLTKLSKEERSQIVTTLKVKFGYSNSTLGKAVNVPKATIDLWSHPERKNKLKTSNLTLIINQIVALNISDIYILSEMKRLNKIIEDKIKNNDLEKTFNKAIGWEE